MSAPGRPLVVSDWPVVVLLAASIGLWALGDRLQAGPGAELYLAGATGVAWYVLGLLLLALVASRTSAPRVSFRQSLFLATACAPPAVLLLWGSSLAPTAALALGVSQSVWLVGAGILAWGLWRVSGRQQWLAVWLCLGAAIGFGWVSNVLYVRPIAWLAADTGGTSEDRSAWIDSERLLFEQPGRIDRAVRALAPREPGRPNAFFVGFAGFGGQKVFAEEIRLASRVIGARFGSAGRSVHLVNDQRNRSEHPLATASGLRRTLLEVGRRMDTASDVLFLVLSSHGQEGAELVVENGSLPLNPLRSGELADALREAGIRWKVVVISACYSGAFIDALKDDYSIILAASAPDRTSFGCADTRELTYFGEAFFRDALPGAASLREAFTRADAGITERERKEGVKPSLPQAFFGVESERHILGLDSRHVARNP